MLTPTPKQCLGAFVVLCSLISSLAHAAPLGDAKRGQQIYNQRCANCHDMNVDRTGPASHYVFGRQAGTGADFDYSPALKSSGLGWNETTLDQWLKNPEALVPGQKMFFMTNDPQDRADVIAYLKQAAVHR
jgi:cytochrome c